MLFRSMALALLAGLFPSVHGLSPHPPGLNEFSRLSGREGCVASIRRAAAAATGRALADGKELLEIEFPPLLETKTQFDDFSNVEELDANRDFGTLLAIEPEICSAAQASSLWLCFADATEAKLAREAWPGARYAEATVTSIGEAVSALGSEPLKPMGSNAADLFNGLFGGENQAAASPPAPPPALQMVVQPGNGGPMEDWLNLELLKRDGTPMLCLNGALDKVTSGYYSNFLNPKLGACSDRFFTKFEQVYYCKPVGAGRGWLFRVYPEPWQLFRQTRTQEELERVETYETRPTPAACVERLQQP